jgi:predicted Zn finger-like uncharacterized protein
MGGFVWWGVDVADDDDNLDPLVTECPNCGTRFRVTEAQLQVAAGRVRCGACLTVFQGTDYLFLDGEPYTPDSAAESLSDLDSMLDELAADPEAAAVDAPASSDAVTGDGPPDGAPDPVALNLKPVTVDDANGIEDVPDALTALEDELLQGLRSDLEQDASGPADAQTQVDETSSGAEPVATLTEVPGGDEMTAPAESERRESFEDLDAADGSRGDRPGGATEGELSEEVSEEALFEAFDDELRAGDALESDAPELAARESGGHETADSIQDSGLEERTEGPAASESPQAADWVNEVEEELWKDESADEETLIEQTAGFGVGELDPEPTAKPASDVAPARDAVQQPAGASIDAVAQPPSFAEEADLPDFAEAEDAPPRPWITYVLIALCVVGLPAQVLWYQYEDWSVDPQYRPVYETACTVLGCTLPAMTDVGMIESKDKAVRSHPEIDDALVVDVLMVNNAAFAQPYPVIELTFSTLQGQLVAGRRFEPEDYLSGEVESGELLLPLTPVHVSLEVEDPGEVAVNYNISFR